MSPDRLKVASKPSTDVRTELVRLNDRITSVVEVFNELVASLREDFKSMDNRFHQLLENGMIARMNERVILVEQEVKVFSSCKDEVHEIKQNLSTMNAEVIKIDQRTKLLLYVGGVIFGPMAAYAIVRLVEHFLGG